MAKNSDAALDVGEIYPEEIPAELMERVAEHYSGLIEVSLQVKRSRWQVLRVGKRSFNTQPPSMSVHDICTDLVSAARKDAEQNGEGQRYRARLRCRLDGHEYSRFANVRCILDDGGALTIVDDGDSDTDNPLKVLSDTAQRYAVASKKSGTRSPTCARR